MAREFDIQELKSLIWSIERAIEKGDRGEAEDALSQLEWEMDRLQKYIAKEPHGPAVQIENLAGKVHALVGAFNELARQNGGAPKILRPHSKQYLAHLALAEMKAAGITDGTMAKLLGVTGHAQNAAGVPARATMPASDPPESAGVPERSRGQEIKWLRNQLEWTQAAVANLAHVSTRTVIRAEKDEANDRTFEVILEALRKQMASVAK
jgi:hypothetical protein